MGETDRGNLRLRTATLAHRNLRRTPVRSGLSVLAIVVGVVLVASLGMAGTTLERSATASLGEVGGDVIVSPAPGTGRDRLATRDLRTIGRVADDVPVVGIDSAPTVVARGPTRRTTVAYRVDRPTTLFTLVSGRSGESGRGGVLVGSTLAAVLDVRTGNTIHVGNRTVRVRGVLDRADPLAPVNPNGAIVRPGGTRDDDRPRRVVIRTRNGEAANATATAIRHRLNGRERRVTVLAMSQVSKRIDAFFDVVDAILLGMGAIALGVGGVGILNVMLLSVAERRGEIGLLRAVGFHRRDVMAMILWEAGFLGAAGVAVGILVSLGLGAGVTGAVFDDPTTVFDPSYARHLGRAAVVGLGVSLGSGVYPAWKAATDPPVEALRA